MLVSDRQDSVSTGRTQIKRRAVYPATALLVSAFNVFTRVGVADQERFEEGEANLKPESASRASLFLSSSAVSQNNAGSVWVNIARESVPFLSRTSTFDRGIPNVASSGQAL